MVVPPPPPPPPPLQVPTRGELWQRADHTLTANSLGPGVTEVLMFAGFSKNSEIGNDLSDNIAQIQIARTSLLLFGECFT